VDQVLPIAQFATDSLEPRQRFDAWRNLVSTVFEATPPDDLSGLDYPAHATSVHFGSVFVVSVAAASQHFTRSQRLIAAEGLDHYLIQVYRHGVCDGTYGEVQNTVHPGDIKVIDLARPFNTFNTQFDNITLTIPRPALAPLLDRPAAMHGTVLGRNTPLGRVVASHLRELSANAASLTPTEGAAVAAATVRLVAACLGANPRARDETMPYKAAAIGQAVRDFIDQHLASPLLEPDTLTQRFHMSRTQLYRLFAEEGGVAAYIQARRLQRCFLTLSHPGHARRGIGEIALGCGFASEAHFSRAFRRAFGITPSEARAAASVPGLLRPAGRDGFLNEWMRGLRPGFTDGLTPG